MLLSVVVCNPILINQSNGKKLRIYQRGDMSMDHIKMKRMISSTHTYSCTFSSKLKSSPNFAEKLPPGTAIMMDAPFMPLRFPVG